MHEQGARMKAAQPVRSILSSSTLRAFAVSSVLALTGCGGPNKGNIDLRKTIQAREEVIAQKDRELAGLRAELRAKERQATTLPTLPQDRLDRLFTMAGVNLTRLTIGVDSDSAKPGDEGFKVAFVPVDQTGQEFKSSGSAAIELFDLAAAEPRLGKWTIGTAELMPKYFTNLLLSCYIVELNWQTIPTRPKLLVKVTFTEELTGRTFETQREFEISPPGK
jgi:hypothetical protein